MDSVLLGVVLLTKHASVLEKWVKELVMSSFFVKLKPPTFLISFQRRNPRINTGLVSNSLLLLWMELCGVHPYWYECYVVSCLYYKTCIVGLNLQQYIWWFCKALMSLVGPLFTIAMLIMDTILSYMYSVTMVLLFFILLLLLRLYSTSAEGL